MNAHDYFLSKNPDYKRFCNKYIKTLKKLDLHHDMLSERLTINFTDALYNRIDQVYLTRNAIVQKARNIESAFNVYCIPLLRKV